MDGSRLPDVSKLPIPTADAPLRILLSACLGGARCGWDGRSYEFEPVTALLRAPHIQVVRFCPEDLAFGTPRPLSDLHGGNGFDVLDGKAKVLTTEGADWTERMLHACRQMTARALAAKVHLAVLTDMSAACGSQVISDGPRTEAERRYQKGPGLAAALLLRAGIPVVSQRDLKTLDRLLSRVSPGHVPASDPQDHHESDWYRSYFAAAR